MSRDYRHLRVFVDADALVIDIYQSTRDFPASERYGLSLQMRRAAVSVPANLVEGSARRSTKEFVNFVNIAAGSAAEVRYLAQLAMRLGFLPEQDATRLAAAYTIVCAKLGALMRSLQDKP